MTDEKPPTIEVEEPDVVEIQTLPYLIVREQGVDGASIRLARCWVFEKTVHPETPLTPNTLQWIEQAAQLLANGIVPEDKSKDSKFKVLK
jgi:hypothetical protein